MASLPLLGGCRDSSFDEETTVAAGPREGQAGLALPYLEALEPSGPGGLRPRELGVVAVVRGCVDLGRKAARAWEAGGSTAQFGKGRKTWGAGVWER